MKKYFAIGLIVLVLLAGAGFGVYSHFKGKTVFNDSYVNGNSSGNLYNSGLFCESGDKIFFANPSDHDRLYSMDTDGTNLKKLSDDVASYINADERYIYYVRNNLGGNANSDFSFLSFNTDSLCRIGRDGGDTAVVLESEPSLYASLVGNYVYYLRYTEGSGTELYKVKIDGSGQKRVNENPYFTASALGQYLYYNGLEKDHFIRRLDTATDEDGIVLDGNCWMPSVTDDSTVYYMDCDHNYRLTRADLSTKETFPLSDDRIDCYNVYGDTVYFQRNDGENSAFCRMNTDGSSYEVLLSGDYTAINVAGGFVYVKDFYSNIMYRIPLTGSEAEIFQPGALK